MKLPYLALGSGLIAYCLILLISRDALIETIIILGTGALGLVSATLWTLWLGDTHMPEQESNSNL